jgi:hypothetical protein
MGALMSGSGSAVFGVWPDWESARATPEPLRAEALWAEAVHTLAVGVGMMGGSQAGKAPVFGTGMRRFESFPPSIALPRDDWLER